MRCRATSWESYRRSLTESRLLGYSAPIRRGREEGHWFSTQRLSSSEQLKCEASFEDLSWAARQDLPQPACKVQFKLRSKIESQVRATAVDTHLRRA